MLAETDTALTAVHHARRELAASLSVLSQVTAGSNHHLSQQAIAQTHAGYAMSELILQQLSAAKRELEAYLAEITGGGSGTGEVGDGPDLVTAPRDPAFDKGPLGDAFTPGVFRREEFTHEHERRTADHLAGRFGWNVYARREIQGEDVKKPDTMVRKDGNDPGRITELKRLDVASYNAVRKRVWDAAVQVEHWGGGDAVVDGRGVGMSEWVARDHVREAIAEAGRKNKPVPARIHVILGDGSMITISGK
ncbi:MAG: hypothetical protein ACRDT6_11640 [Micromonosporaceae bacterium]